MLRAHNKTKLTDAFATENVSQKLLGLRLKRLDIAAQSWHPHQSV